MHGTLVRKSKFPSKSIWIHINHSISIEFNWNHTFTFTIKLIICPSVVCSCLLILPCSRIFSFTVAVFLSLPLAWSAALFLNLNVCSVLARLMPHQHQPFNNVLAFLCYMLESNMLRCDKLHAKLLWPKLFQNWENWIFKFRLQLHSHSHMNCLLTFWTRSQIT